MMKMMKMIKSRRMASIMELKAARMPNGTRRSRKAAMAVQMLKRMVRTTMMFKESWLHHLKTVARMKKKFSSVKAIISSTCKTLQRSRTTRSSMSSSTRAKRTRKCMIARWARTSLKDPARPSACRVTGAVVAGHMAALRTKGIT